LIGDVLGWSAETRAHEVEHYIARVDAERASQDRIDDHAADAVRSAAPEVRAHLTADALATG
jgi:glycerol-3-phosphate dehydrogenase